MHTVSLNILIIEDHEAIALNLAEYLEGQGHTLDFAATGQNGLELALRNPYDVVILDLMLPGMEGLEVCKQIRERAVRHIPVLMLTARDTVKDKVVGFQLGADDYVTKPFALEELEVRCIALSRRHLLQADHIMEIGSLMIDRKLKQVTRDNIAINLSHTGYKIVEYLAEAYPQVVTRSELIQKIWNDEPTETDALRSHIYQIRTVLDKPFEAPVLKTIHGVGFVLEVAGGNV